MIKEQIEKNFPNAKIKDKGFTFKKGVGETGRVFLSELKSNPSHIFFTDTKDGVVRYITNESLVKASTGNTDGITYDREYDGSFFFDKTHLLKWDPTKPVKDSGSDLSKLDFVPNTTVNNTMVTGANTPTKETSNKINSITPIISFLEKNNIDFEINIKIK